MIIRFIRIIVSNIRQILSNVEYAGVNTQEDKMDITVGRLCCCCCESTTTECASSDLSMVIDARFV